MVTTYNKKSVFLYINFFAAAVLLIFLYLDGHSIDSDPIFIARVVLFLSIVQLIFSFKAGKNKISFAALFVILLIYYFISSVATGGWLSIGHLPFFFYSEINFAVLFVSLCITSIWVGYSYYHHQNFNRINEKKYFSSLSYDRNIYNVGLFFLYLSCIYYVFEFYNSPRWFLSYGTYATASNVSSRLNSLFFPILMVGLPVCIAGMASKREKILVLIPWVIICGTQLIVGDRRIPFMGTLCAIWLLHHQKVISTKKIVLAFMIGLFVLPVFASLRTVAISDLGLSKIKNSFQSMSFERAINSGGGQIIVFLISDRAMRINDQNLWFGKSMIYPLKYLVPNIYISDEHRVVENEFNVAKWIAGEGYRFKKSGQGSWGAGIVVESYISFGLIGSFVFFSLFGMLIAFFENGLLQKSLIWYISSLCFLFNFLTIVRDALAIIYKPFFWGILFFIVCLKIYKAHLAGSFVSSR